ncbi:hypothetical protein [Sporolactobacillus vineae]|uniref:hypothetical protein n=1 Tax=Sporolactobacillus vineae TaxID=444463 RepID=UPI0002885474|nr:hypothetical protein [Sporolactobacillus vineae]
MKKLTMLFTIVLSVLLIAGCSYGSGTESGYSSAASSASSIQQQIGSSAAASSSETAGASSAAASSGSVSSSSVNQTTGAAKLGTLSRTLADIRIALKPRSGIHLPGKVSVHTGNYISAIAKNTSNGYTVTFKQTNRPLKVNAPQLAGAATVVKFSATVYQTRSEAGKQVSFHKYGKSDGSPVNLGHGLTGYADAGAGTAGISWNEGRWTLMALSPTSDTQKGQALAKQVVNYLESHSLPVPHQYGVIQVYTDSRQNYAFWQDGRTIYQLTGTASALNLLSTAVSVR